MPTRRENKNVCSVFWCVLTAVVILIVLGFASRLQEVEVVTILEVEEQYGVELLAPTVRELQAFSNMKAAELKLDFSIREENIWGPNTLGALSLVRCQQEFLRCPQVKKETLQQ